MAVAPGLSTGGQVVVHTSGLGHQVRHRHGSAVPGEMDQERERQTGQRGWSALQIGLKSGLLYVRLSVPDRSNTAFNTPTSLKMIKIIQNNPPDPNDEARSRLWVLTEEESTCLGGFGLFKAVLSAIKCMFSHAVKGKKVIFLPSEVKMKE